MVCVDTDSKIEEDKQYEQHHFSHIYFWNETILHILSGLVSFWIKVGCQTEKGELGSSVQVLRASKRYFARWNKNAL